MTRSELAGVLVLLVLLSTGKRSSSRWPRGPWPEPLPPDENLGVHPLPPNPLRK